MEGLREEGKRGESQQWGLSWVFRDLETITAVLVLAGAELIFFLVANLGLCFGFVLETVLIIQGHFSSDC